MNREQALDLIARTLAEIAPGVDIAGADPKEDLRRAFDLDSVDFLTLLERLAEQVAVEVPEDAYAQASTLGGLADLVVRGSVGAGLHGGPVEG